MTRKLSIDDIKNEALDRYNLTLLSTTYINSRTKMEWLDNKTGIIFKRDWHSINAGQITPGNPHKKLSIDDIKNKALDRYNFTLLNTTYIDSHTKMEWLDNKTGHHFVRSWDLIKRGATGIGVALRIEDIRDKALSEYGFILLSKEYNGTNKPMEWKDIKTGITFKRSWSNIKRGQVSVSETRRRMTRQEVYDLALKRYNLTLLSNEYHKSTDTLKWKDNKTGNIFYRPWFRITSSQYSTIRTSNINDYNTEKKEIESFEGLGYKVITSEEKYNSGFRQGDAHLFEIVNPSIEGVWVTTKSAFKIGAVSHLNKSNVSAGETILISILTSNSIAFEYQKRVMINDELHIFDFYLPDYSLFIEYDGEQHYRPVRTWGGKKAYDIRLARDKTKDNYVKSLSKMLIRIPYTLKSSSSIINALNTETTLSLNKDDIVIIDNKHKDVAEYYEYHTLKETAAMFNVEYRTITQWYREQYGMSKSQRKEGKVV